MRNIWKKKEAMKDVFEKTLAEENDTWDKKVMELKQHFVAIENEMIDRQKSELEKLRMTLENNLPMKSKPSSTLLNLRAVQQNLVKQKKYAEAEESKKKALEMEAEEDRKWQQIRGEKIAFQEAQLMQKHGKEREAHNKRAQTALAELDKERTKKVAQLTQNFNNLSKQNANAHNIEMAHISKMDKKSSPPNEAIEDMTESSPTK